MTIPGFKTIGDEGHNRATSEYWTTIAGKRIYSRSLEALCRTVAFGWTEKKASEAESDVKFVCLYCGREGYITSEPCSCFLTKGDRGKRISALNRLQQIMYEQKVEETKKKKEKPKSPIILP